nr:hypothetical protein [Anabaena sp. UHCC 0253]
MQERLSAIELSLDVKFGREGLELISEISQISDLERLKIIHKDILTVHSLDQLREIIQNIHISEPN